MWRMWMVESPYSYGDDLMREEKEEKLRQMVKDLSNICNGASSQQDKIADILFKQFMVEHNTLEQCMLGVIQKFICKIASHPYYSVDGRNEDSYHWAKNVAEIDARFPFI